MKVGEIVTINYKKYRVISDSSGDGLTIEPYEDKIDKQVEEIHPQPEAIKEITMEQKLEKRLDKIEEKLDNLISITKMIYKYI